VGCGRDHTVRELAEIIRRVVGFEGGVTWDGSRPDGMARKLLDVSRLSGLGWRAQIDLIEGIGRTYDWYCDRSR
jgi:GDP-L-fucose synthase